jgi:hypothetical protein
MSQLRIYKQNGGKIYDLVMEQKIREEKQKKAKIQDQIIKGLRNKISNKYDNTVNTRLTTIETGHKTGLYTELRKIVGRCG